MYSVVVNCQLLCASFAIKFFANCIVCALLAKEKLRYFNKVISAERFRQYCWSLRNRSWIWNKKEYRISVLEHEWGDSFEEVVVEFGSIERMHCKYSNVWLIIKMQMLLWCVISIFTIAKAENEDSGEQFYNIEGQVIVPESFDLLNGKLGPSRVLVNYGEHTGFVRYLQ